MGGGEQVHQEKSQGPSEHMTEMAGIYRNQKQREGNWSSWTGEV